MGDEGCVGCGLLRRVISCLLSPGEEAFRPDRIRSGRKQHSGVPPSVLTPRVKMPEALFPEGGCFCCHVPHADRRGEGMKRLKPGAVLVSRDSRKGFRARGRS